MRSQDQEPPEAATRQNERRNHYAAAAAERLRAATDCQFALLSYDELARMAASWYDACAQGMLRGNYAPLDQLVCELARVAAQQEFALPDLLQLLRLFRDTAIRVEGWNEDQFTNVDAVIDEALGYLGQKVPWQIPQGLNYLTGKSRQEVAEVESARVVDKPRTERRIHRRNRLHLPIRIRAWLSTGELDETTRTENVARGGLYFLSRHPYYERMQVQVTYPYWQGPNAINRDYPAKVVRIDERPEYKGVALKFLVSLGGLSTPV